MALVTCNSQPVLSLRLSLPRWGAWVADVEITSDQPLSGRASIADGERVWNGTVLRSGVFAGRSQARIVGAVGLRKVLPARSYVGVVLRAVAQDVVAAAGETLASGSSRVALGSSLPYWTRSRGSAGAAVAKLVEQIGAAWRVEPKGGVWIGVDTFPVQRFEHDELIRCDSLGTALISSESLDLRPGVTFDGRRVSRVEHAIEGGALRTSYWFDQ